VVDDGFCLDRCEDCAGAGWRRQCPHCEGEGRDWYNWRASGYASDNGPDPCPWCEEGEARPCRVCAGTGVDPSSDEGEYCQHCEGAGQDPDWADEEA
jgi:hypothetical protein